MERLSRIKDILITHIENQVENLECADCEELGEAIDMVKDIEEAMYYCVITHSMLENKNISCPEDFEVNMQSLAKYVNRVIDESTPQEKQALKKRITDLANKIA